MCFLFFCIFSVMGLLSRRKQNSRFLYQVLTILLMASISIGSKLEASFVFGDSLVDAGNNNFILSLSKANYIPNGIDYGKPTGRFTNGRTIVDIIGQELGLEDSTPPYLAPTTVGSVVLQGVNYASGGGGILNHTGKIFGGRINMDAQIDNFANTREDMIEMIGVSAVSDLLRKALFSVTMGSNDFINNYLTPVLSAAEQKLVPPEVFVGSMIARFRLQLQRLYNLGARKIVVVNVGPIGCIPFERELNPAEGENCASFPNEMAQLYNKELRSLVEELSGNLEGSHLVYANVYNIVSDILQNYISFGLNRVKLTYNYSLAYGIPKVCNCCRNIAVAVLNVTTICCNCDWSSLNCFENANSSCCYCAGKFGGLIPCGPSSKVCFDRSKYVFWDPYHPSEAANLVLAKRLLDGDSIDVSPINIRQLVMA